MRRLGVLAAAALLAASGAAHAQPPELALGATLQGLLDAGRRLSPALRAAALDTEAADAAAGGADALDDPTITDSYQYYKDPGVFSAHTVMLSQAFPLWGKRSLRRRAALADVDARSGRERAAEDRLAEGIKIAYAGWYLAYRDLAVNREIAVLAARMRAAATARYSQGGGDQSALILALGEQTSAKEEQARLEGERDAARARLNALAGRPGDAPLATPMRPRPVPAGEPVLADLVDRARAANPTLAAGDAAVAAARTRNTLAERASYPDITIAAGPLIQTNDRPVGFAATVGLNIPVPWGREESGRREAAAALGASELRYDAARLEIEGALGEALARLRAARATARLLDSEAMPQASGLFRSALAAYGQGRGDMGTALAAEHQMHGVELRALQAELDEQVELAAIERLIGGDL